SEGKRTRANKWAATALLARVYLYTRNWADAEKQASMLLDNNSLFGLPRNLAEVFTPSSNEAIWQLYNNDNGVTEYATQVIPNPSDPIPTFVLTDELKNAFESGDSRIASWTATITYQGTTYTYPTKYKSRVQNANEEYLTILRLAEQFLIRAEARAQQNNISGAKADIFSVRNRANLGETSANDKDALLLAIEKERQVELNTEWGHRWFDLRRTSRINEVLSAAKSAWTATDALYPVPQIQRNNNPSLSQNLGYN
ncbi:MAG: RagB/SusD family nutrient uptake outer membrane protein, partial [Pedobacter sp.]